MGSDFLTNKQLQTALEQNPELVTWSSLREVILHRGKTGKLGFKVHTFKVIHPLPLFFRPTIKNCWFAVLLPTRQNWPYPKNFMAILRNFFFFFFFFFQKSKNKDSFSQNYSFQNLFYVLTMFLLYCLNFNIANYKDNFLVQKKKKKKKKKNDLPTYPH